jgi:hypothetical protein
MILVMTIHLYLRVGCHIMVGAQPRGVGRRVCHVVLTICDCFDETSIASEPTPTAPSSPHSLCGEHTRRAPSQALGLTGRRIGLA